MAYRPNYKIYEERNREQRMKKFRIREKLLSVKRWFDKSEKTLDKERKYLGIIQKTSKEFS